MSMRWPTGLRWKILALFVCAMVLNYLARVVVGFSAPVILGEQRISTAQYGLITGAFQLGLMLQPAAGYLLDRIGLKAGLAMCALVWSLLTMVHIVASGWFAFAILRAVIGTAEGSAQPAGQKLVAEWFPARERGLAGGIYNIGASFGAVLAPPLVVWSVHAGSWRYAFLIAGTASLIWVAAWWKVYHSPDLHPRVTPAELRLIHEGRDTSAHHVHRRRGFMVLIRQRNLWGIALPRMLADPVWGMLSFWMPLYLARERGFELVHIAMVAWLPFIAADLGCLFGPACVTYLQRRGLDLVTARKCAFTIGAILMTAMASIEFAVHPYALIGLLCLAGFAHQTLSVTVITLASDLFHRDEVATAAGMAGLAANLGVAIFSMTLGGLVDEIGFKPFFLALGTLDLLGAGLLWWLVRNPAAPSPVRTS